jgi:thioester reductase-like protein
MRRDWPFAPCAEVATAATLVEVLAWRAETTPEKVGYTWLEGEGLTDEEPLTYGALYGQVCRAACVLSETLANGDRAILLFESGLDFLRALLGCQAAGCVPVPVMPPRDGSPSEVGRVLRILADAATQTVVTTAPIAALAKALPGAEALRWLVLDPDTLAAAAPAPPRAAAQLALLQYTSGSTRAPRGVMVGHDNLLRNLAYIYWGENSSPETVSVSWLPMTHDMGLVEGVLQPLYSGRPAFLFSPRSFLRSPVGWLEVISRTGAAVSGGPNFAYDLVLRRLGSGPLPDLDLSRWAFAYDGSEPVRAETIEAFCDRLAPRGFRRSAFQPLYGLAEATLGVTAGRFGAEPRFLRRVGACGVRRVVSCGVPPDDLQVMVVDPETARPLAPGEEGEIWLQGPCIARGYWRAPEATEETFGATLPGSAIRYLRTGDLGFVHDGEVFVTGRRKELIVCRGANVHPGDLEATAEAAHPRLRPGGAVAFGIERDGLEAVVVVAEIARGSDPHEPLGPIVSAVRRAVARTHGVPVAQVALVPAGTIPRTTSGKRQRALVARSWHQAKLPVLASGGPESAPQESLADWLPARVATLLGTEASALDLARTLPELGLGSLAIIELLSELEARFGRGSLGALLTRPLGALTDEVEQSVSPSAQARLPDSLVFRPGPLSPPAGDAVLLTGATGWLGGYLARSLLQSTRHRLICLVRGDPGRLLATLSAVPGWREEWAPRVEAVAGDLAAAGLGLGETQLEALSGRLGGIVHAGAMVNWVYPFSALAAANVGGTHSLLALAARRSTPLVYVSSLACCWSLTASGIVDESTDPAEHLDGIHLDYVRTKAVAESLVRQAGERGLPIRVLRPGLIIGDSETGHHSPGDFLSALFRGCIELGAAPDLDWELEVCPVDEVARVAVTALDALGREGSPGTVHLQSPERRPWRGVVLWMALRGHALALLPYDLWCERLVDAPASNALRPLEAFFVRPAAGELRLPQLYERSRRNRIESRFAPVGSPLDALFLERTFRDLTAQGYLPGPDDAAQRPLPTRSVSQLARCLGRAVDEVEEVPWPQGHTSASLIGELASWRYGRAAGVRRLRLRSGSERWTVVEKGQVEDWMALDIGERVAWLCSPALGAAWRAHRDHSEAVRSAEREAALYQLADPRLRAHSPRCLGVGPGVLLLEDLSGVATDWDTLTTVQAAIRGLAQLHAIGPVHAPWTAPPRTAAELKIQQPLWDALAEHAMAGPVGRWLGTRGRDRYRALLAELPEWAALADALPQTLIHNDLSPRNAIVRDGVLCAWDWELARTGLPQRDLAELLCFTWTGGYLSELLELHRSELARAGGVAPDASAWRAGFEVALADLLVTRISLYAMIDGFQRQPFLERVVRTWVQLDTQIRGDARV